MPRKELHSGQQIEDWLKDLGASLSSAGSLTLIGSGGLLWHAFHKGITEPLPENSMDVDPISDSEEVALACYDSQIGSEFERTHGWHVNIMPSAVLEKLPPDWSKRQVSAQYGLLTVYIPDPDDLLVPKVRRGEPRDLAHARWAFMHQVCLRNHTPLVSEEVRLNPEDDSHELLP